MQKIIACKCCDHVRPLPGSGLRGSEPVVVNCNFVRAGFLPGHGDGEGLTFCSPLCVVEFFTTAAAPELVWVLAKDARTGSCDECRQPARSYLSVHAPEGSRWACEHQGSPNYFCSVRCLIAAFKRDDAPWWSWWLERPLEAMSETG